MAGVKCGSSASTEITTDTTVAAYIAQRPMVSKPRYFSRISRYNSATSKT